MIKTFGSNEERIQTCDVVDLLLKTREGKNVQLTFLAVPFICDPLARQPLSHAMEIFPYLSELELADTGGEADIDVLVGSDLYWSLVTGRIIRGENGPTAIETVFGWVLSGPVDSAPEAFVLTSTHTLRVESSLLLANHKIDTPLDSQLQKFWDLEVLGIQDHETSVYDEFVKKISFKDGRYEVHLPWKEQHPPLGDHYQMSLNRLISLLQRLKRSPEVLKEYDTVIKNQLSSGIIEIASKPNPSSQVHYLPHHPVIRSDRDTTKFRIVYDASAKTTGTSLNDCLYVGPPFGQYIFDIILRFRVHNVALAGDIEKAFSMISIAEEDRDALRFLWVNDPFKKFPEIILRFKRVIFGVSASPFLLNATIEHHISKYRSADPQFVSQFLRSIYVDDVTYGSSDVNKTYDLYCWSKKKLAEGGFHLRKFVTNSTVLRSLINEQEMLQPKHSTEPEKTATVSVEDESYAANTLRDKVIVSPEEKILGVSWNFITDHLIFDTHCISDAASDSTPSKRTVVSVATRFYDPLGILAPFIIKFKMLFQELCKAKLAWDEPLTGELLKDWNRIVADATPHCT